MHKKHKKETANNTLTSRCCGPREKRGSAELYVRYTKGKYDMEKIGENELAALLLETGNFRAVESNIYSVLPNNESGNEYDSQFGFIYDLIACNPIYNRLIWGYSVKIFSRTASEALHSFK